MPNTRLSFGLVLLTFSLFAQADQGELIVYSEHQRLSANSLLLDIVQTSQDILVAVGERGHVVISDDGVNWVQAEVVPSRSTLTVVTEARGQLWAAGHDSVILSSGDGGNTWTRQYFDPERNQPIMDIKFTASGRGFAIGAYGLMLVTDDDGDTWEDREISEDGWHLNAFLDVGDGRLMIAGEAGFSYRSFDDGLTWETHEMPYPGSMFGLINRADGCIVQFGLRGHIQESCDFGDTWTEPDSNTTATISGSVQSGSGLLLVGNSGLVLEQDPGGNYFSSIHSGGGDFASVIGRNGTFLLVGEDGVHIYPEAGETGTD